MGRRQPGDLGQEGGGGLGAVGKQWGRGRGSVARANLEPQGAGGSACDQILTRCMSPFQVAPSPPSQMVLTSRAFTQSPMAPRLATLSPPRPWCFLADGRRPWLIPFSVLEAPWRWKGVNLHLCSQPLLFLPSPRPGPEGSRLCISDVSARCCIRQRLPLYPSHI